MRQSEVRAQVIAPGAWKVMCAVPANLTHYFLRPRFCDCSHSESALHITSQPGYGRSPYNVMCMGHFSAWPRARPHVQRARLLLRMSCSRRAFRSAFSFWQSTQAMACELFLFFADKSFEE